MCVASRWTLAQTDSVETLKERQERLHNTYYNNMVCYINNKNGDGDSTVSAMKVGLKIGSSTNTNMNPIKSQATECAYK